MDPRPAQAMPDAPRLRRRDLDVLAARTLAWLSIAAVAAGAVAVALLEGITAQARWVMLGLLAVLALALGAMYRLAAREHPKLVILATLGAALATNTALALGIGVGVHGHSMGLMALLVALAGALIGLRAAAGLAALSVLAVIGMYLAEGGGWIGAMAVAGALPPANRVYTLLVVIGVGLVAAVALSRLYMRALDSAIVQGDRLDTLLRISADWVWEQDAQGRITYISEAFVRGSGVPHHEFTGRCWWDVPGLHEPEGGWQPLRELIATRSAAREQTLVSLNGRGQRRSMRFTIEPRFDDVGNFAGHMGVARDVTAEVEADAQRLELQQLLEALFRTSVDAVVLCDLPAGTILMMNQSLARLIKYSEAEAIGRTTVELGIWVDDSERQRIMALVARAKRASDIPARFRDRDGRCVPVTVTATRFEHAGRHYMMATAHDQSETERARAESAVLLENAAMGIALVRDSRFARVNPMFDRMLGAEPGQLVGGPVRELFRDERDRTLLDTDTLPLAADPFGYEHVGQVQRLDGTVFTGRLRVRSLSREPGAASVWLLEDFTERERAQRLLEQAKTQAEAASRAKSAFLATMSHEIRTPLNGTLGMIRLALENDITPAKREEYLNHAAASAETLAGLIGDILDLSRIEAGRLQLEQSAFDLHALAQRIVSAHAPQAAAKGLRLGFALAPDVPAQTYGDPMRLRQVVTNFLANAIKFTEAGAVELELSMREARLRVTVRDSGPGIAPDVQARLFRPFEQADETVARRHGGTGLGLSICRELVGLMGGEVGVHSQPGHGSLFWAEWPLRTAPAVESPRTHAPANRPLAGMRVLVVEDNPVNMLIATETLRSMGAEVGEAGDGDEAIAALPPGHGYDAVLMDMQMPRMSGLEATIALRDQPHTRSLPIIALTAAAISSERQQAHDAGMDDFVAKPVDSAQLLAALLRVRAAAQATT
jgi:PAS domain S-box-containing protein